MVRRCSKAGLVRRWYKPAWSGAGISRLVPARAAFVVRANLEALLDTEVDERLALALRVPGDVEDVLLRVNGRDLAPQLLEALDDADRGISVERKREIDQPAVHDARESNLGQAGRNPFRDVAHACPCGQRPPGSVGQCDRDLAHYEV